MAALGAAQTLAWASSYYLPAILAPAMARDLQVEPTAIFGAFSAALLLSAALAPSVGRAIDRRGGRPVLAASSLMFAAGLVVLGVAPSFAVLCAGWLLLGAGMAFGLYEAAFATLAGLYGRQARAGITGITLIAGFASTVGWPVSAALLDGFGWRGACVAWAAANLVLGLPLNRLLIPATPPPARARPEHGEAAPKRAMLLLACAFAAMGMVSTAMAAQLPLVLRADGVGAAEAVAAAALVGPAQVGARVAEFVVLRRMHPLLSARIASVLHPAGAGLLLLLGPVAAVPFALLHGAGNGMVTIARGTLPLALFGPGGYGLRTGILSAPARLLQAGAPVGFAWALQRYGPAAVLVTAGLSVVSLAALLALRAGR